MTPRLISLLRTLGRVLDYLRYCWGCLARSLGFHLIPSKHKTKIHIAILGVIAWDIIHVGAKIGDLGFLLLSLLMEAESAEAKEQLPLHWRDRGRFKTPPRISPVSPKPDPYQIDHDWIDAGRK